MAPRQPRQMQTQQARPQLVTPPDTFRQPSGNAPTRRSNSTTAPAEGESFDLDNVSGSSNDEDNHLPVRQAGRPQGTAQATTVTPAENSGFNDPSIAAPSDSKTAGADTRYFFERLADKVVCRECR